MASKVCSRCKQEKDTGEFCKNRRMRDGRGVWCKACQAASARERYARDPELRRKVKERQQTPEGRARNALAQKKWQEAHPEAWRACHRNSRLKHDYGIDTSAFERMVAAREGRCDICGRVPKLLQVDHDHRTGAVRGLLCATCNKALGFLGDTREAVAKALGYLGGHERRFEPLTFIA